MKERRQFERLLFEVSARMETTISDKKQLFEYKTKDISAAGAFIFTPEPFSIGTRVKIDLITSNERIRELTGVKSLIECEGSVIRSTPTGVGVRFDSECKILALKGI
jgi:Tfp pilus assembly protein PilZ